MLFRLFLRKQIRPFLLIFLAFSLFLLLTLPYQDDYAEDRAAYLQRFDCNDRSRFFSVFSEESQIVNQRVTDIENYINYGGELPEGEIDEIAQLIGDFYVNPDMLSWKEAMLRLPGQYTATLRDDYNMLTSLSGALSRQDTFEEDLANNRELLRRALRRGGPDISKYQAALAASENIRTDFPITDSSGAQAFLQYLESDYFLYLMLILCCFGLFASAAQNRIPLLILTSRLNMRRYVWQQTLAALTLAIPCILLYWLFLLLLYSGGTGQRLALSLPIQTMHGYQTVPFALTIGQYLLSLLALRLIFSLVCILLTLGLSLLARNTTLAALYALLYGSFFVIGFFIMNGSVRAPSPYAAGISYLLGGGVSLFTGLPYASLGSALLPLPILYGLLGLLAAGGLLTLNLWLCKPLAKGRVK